MYCGRKLWSTRGWLCGHKPCRDKSDIDYADGRLEVEQVCLTPVRKTTTTG